MQPCSSGEVISIKTEDVKVEEIPEPISFPEIKAEPDEVSYVSLYHEYTIMARLFSGLCYAMSVPSLLHSSQRPLFVWQSP